MRMNNNYKYTDYPAPLFAASETVSFSKRDSSGRASFLINDTPSRSISFKDLAGLYLKVASRAVYCCSIKCSDKSYQICRLNENEFWEIVKGKQFKVVVDISTNRLKDEAIDPSMTISDNVNHVFSLLDAGKNDGLNTVMEKSPCYQFVEIKN